MTPDTAALLAQYAFGSLLLLLVWITTRWGDETKKKETQWREQPQVVTPDQNGELITIHKDANEQNN